MTPADVPDGEEAADLVPAAQAVAPTLRYVWVDGGYTGDWADWAAEEQGVTGAVVRRPAGQRGVVVQAKRWVGERTIAWVSRQHRQMRDVEHEETTSQTLIYLASCHRLLKRLYPAPNN